LDKETFYFPHDYNASQDPKIMMLLTSCGLSGVGMFWILIEILHQQPDGKLAYEAYKQYIEFYATFDSDRGEHLLNTIEQELINTKLLSQKDGFVFSNRVLSNKKQREILSEKRSLAGKISAELRLKRTSVEQVSTSVQHPCSTKVNKERKGKERKGNKGPKEIYIEKNTIIKSYGSLNNVLLTEIERTLLERNFNTTLPDRIERLSLYIASTGKKYKSHYATILAWARKDESEGKYGTRQRTSSRELPTTYTDPDIAFGRKPGAGNPIRQVYTDPDIAFGRGPETNSSPAVGV
jgi:hypothetical protein